MGRLLLLLLASFIEAAPADSGGREAALERLSAREAAARGDPAVSAALAKDYLELGENRRGLALAERLLAADPSDGPDRKRYLVIGNLGATGSVDQRPPGFAENAAAFERVLRGPSGVRSRQGAGRCGRRPM